MQSLWKPVALLLTGIIVFAIFVNVSPLGSCGPRPRQLAIFLSSLGAILIGGIWLIIAIVGLLRSRRTPELPPPEILS